MKQIKAYDHKQIEPKWQGIWDSEKLYEPNIKTAEKPFYNLFMFPYPSAEGMHAGHAMSSTGSDIFGRFQRMHDFDVLQPMGYDSFGIHSENYAIKIGETPQKMLTHAKTHFGEQFKSFGHGYAWSKELSTSDIDYYRWTQWLFVQMFKAGLAYKRHATVNFCPYDKTVLADEQVMSPHQAGKEPHLADGTPVEDRDGLLVCERCGTVVEKKELSQWFFRITDYAERLLENLSKIDWSERVKVAQKEWIGKSEGREVRFTIYDSKTEIPVFTTKPETILGVTFIAISPEKAKDLLQYMPKVCKSAVAEYIKTSLNKSDQNRKLGQKDKTGVDTGLFALNPANKEKIRIWVADYVLADVGTGAVMGVPAGDERDHEFAVKHNIDVKQYKNFTKSIGERQVRYHLRDWLVSRQRYWGPPIPMIFCEHCAKQGKSWFSQNSKALHSDQSDWDCAGWYPEENLPIELPQIDDYKPRGNGKGPLANFPDFYKVKCPICGSEATRETDVSDTFVDSSWYFLRYPSIGYESASKYAFDADLIKKWLPVDLYFGGAEHAVLHLMYARFVTMLLHDLGYLDFEEPFPKFFAHGLMIKDGAKMSKSRGNVVNPDVYIKKFGADTLRLYLVFIGPMDGYPDFRDNGIEGMHRFVKKLWRLMHQNTTQTDQSVTAKRHQTIKKVTNDISIFHYNTAIASIMEYINILEEKGMSREDLVVLTQLLAPFAPHVAEEIWREVLGNTDSVHKSTWPTYEEKYLQEQSIVIPVQINGKLRGQVNIDFQALANKDKVIEMAINNEKLSSWLKDKQIKNVIYVEGKILNLII